MKIEMAKETKGEMKRKTKRKTKRETKIGAGKEGREVCDGCG